MPASTYTASDLASVASHTVSHCQQHCSTIWGTLDWPTKKRSRQSLSNDEMIDSALAALKDVRAVMTLLLAATKPATSDPTMYLVVDCLSFVVKKSMVASLPWS